jgi:hypothetical protein
MCSTGSIPADLPEFKYRFDECGFENDTCLCRARHYRLYLVRDIAPNRSRTRILESSLLELLLSILREDELPHNAFLGYGAVLNISDLRHLASR